MKQSNASMNSQRNPNSAHSTQKDADMVRNYVCVLPPIGKKSSFKVEIKHEDEVRDMTVTYIEEKNGKYYRRRLNLQSPRTKEAADYLGVDYEDCVVG